jgi:hypothetical protein
MWIQPSIEGSETCSGIGSPPAAPEPGLAITVSATARTKKNRKRISSSRRARDAVSSADYTLNQLPQLGDGANGCV